MAAQSVPDLVADMPPLLRLLSETKGLAPDAPEQRARANMRWEKERLASDAASVEEALAA